MPTYSGIMFVFYLCLPHVSPSHGMYVFLLKDSPPTHPPPPSIIMGWTPLIIIMHHHHNGMGCFPIEGLTLYCPIDGCGERPNSIKTILRILIIGKVERRNSKSTGIVCKKLLPILKKEKYNDCDPWGRPKRAHYTLTFVPFG